MVNRDGDRNVPYCNQNGSRWDDNWNWLDNDFNSNGRVAFGNWQWWSTMSGGFGTTCGLSDPSAEHFADLIQRLGQHHIFSVINGFYLPGDLKEQF